MRLPPISFFLFGEHKNISLFLIFRDRHIFKHTDSDNFLLYKNSTFYDFLILNHLKQHSSVIGHMFRQAHEMDSIYENSGFILSTVASSEKPSRFNDNSTEEQEREVTSPKWIKVLLIVLGFSLVFALGGLCALWMLYNQKLADFELLNNQHIMISKQLSAQEINGTIMKKEYFILTARYNTLRKWLSFYDAKSCNLSVDGWIACRGKLYLFSSDKLNWSSSRDVCVSKGADLVTITSQSEQDFLVSKIKETHWIGLNDLETEGHWVWVNNQTLSETGVQFWFREGPREPDNWKNQDPSGENCASLGDENGNFQSWFDASCKKQKKFICEKKY
uniref:C-type lectin domain-containing protein n=1 Tax=Cyprinus carpio TaxID=7962 RepID=A0A8C1MKQ8_CYPCA